MKRRPARFVGLLVRGYALFISPVPGANGRFQPRCSRYAVEARRTHGALRGDWLALQRMGRSALFHAGGHDPGPPARSTQRGPNPA